LKNKEEDKSMKTMGFLISHKNGEKRRAILPEQIANLKYPAQLYFEAGYGQSVGVADEEYEACGCQVVSREEAMKCDIIADVKLGDADYLEQIEGKKILFGWAHTVQNVDFTSKILEKGHTVVAWEEIFEDGRYIFYRNREVAGEAAVLHAYRYCGKMPYDTKVAILGNGQTAKGAMRILHGLGATVDVYGRRLEQLFRKKMTEYDVLVNCVMWDTSREDRIIYKEDLKRMKPGTLIIDVSCDPYLEIETSHPTTIDDPVYTVDGVIHYAVDNTPAMYPITVTKVLSEGLERYIDMMLTTDFEEYPDNVKDATVILEGRIRDERIRAFREARGLFCK
jgi:N5-(carboxyethyl)ornithine synthase